VNLCINPVSQEDRKKKSGTVCSHGDADNLLQDVLSELDRHVIDKELQYTDDFIFCAALFA
jgi:hypothetical protein